MEELVGKIWHRYITRVADQRFPEAAVNRDEMRRTAAIFFRALGGEGGLRVEQTLETESGARLLQRIAGTGKKAELAWRDEETGRIGLRFESLAPSEHARICRWLGTATPVW